VFQFPVVKVDKIDTTCEQEKRAGNNEFEILPYLDEFRLIFA
jgi:hypothetical protein